MCVQIVSCLPVPLISTDIALSTVNGDKFMICDYLSHHWMNNVLFKGDIPKGTRVSIFDNYDMEDLMEENLIKIFNTINADGG